jgi:hypothetical protein
MAPPGRILQAKISTMLAAARPAADHPRRVLGRCQKELERFVMLHLQF